MPTGTDAVTATSWGNTEVDRRWLKRFGRCAVEPVSACCASTTPAAARRLPGWPAALPAAVEAVAVQLPGRADRFLEPPHERWPS